MPAAQVDPHGLGLECELRVHIQQFVDAVVAGILFVVEEHGVGLVDPGHLGQAFVGVPGPLVPGAIVRADRPDQFVNLAEQVLPLTGVREFEVGLQLLGRLCFRKRRRFRIFDPARRSGHVTRPIAEAEVLRQGRVVVKTQFFDGRGGGAVCGLVENLGRINLVRRIGEELIDRCW